MRKLYFKRSNGEYVYLEKVKDLSDASMLINEFLNSKEYASYYTRIWTEEDGVTWFDVGSHSEFFCLMPEGFEKEPDNLSKY